MVSVFGKVSRGVVDFLTPSAKFFEKVIEFQDSGTNPVHGLTVAYKNVEAGLPSRQEECDVIQTRTKTKLFELVNSARYNIVKIEARYEEWFDKRYLIHVVIHHVPGSGQGNKLRLRFVDGGFGAWSNPASLIRNQIAELEVKLDQTVIIDDSQLEKSYRYGVLAYYYER